MERILGLVFSGFAVRLYGAALALYVGSKAVALITETLGSASNALQ